MKGWMGATPHPRSLLPAPFRHPLTSVTARSGSSASATAAAGSGSPRGVAVDADAVSRESADDDMMEGMTDWTRPAREGGAAAGECGAHVDGPTLTRPDPACVPLASSRPGRDAPLPRRRRRGPGSAREAGARGGGGASARRRRPAASPGPALGVHTPW